MKLTLGFSPCPNDTFIFDALVNKKIDVGGFEFEVILEDVQTLNEWAIEGKLDVSKISYGVLPLILNEYVVLTAGGALGKGVGPLLISKREIKNIEKEIDSLTFALPGENTTAHLLFSLAFPEAKRKKFLLFSDIEKAVLDGEADAGVIIHENRFTYEKKGLKKVLDLGAYWEQQTRCPIPLGGIVARRTLRYGIQQKVNRLIRDSVEFAFSNYPALSKYIRQNSSEMDEAVMRQHINLYVNEYSLDIGLQGEKAIWELLEIYSQINHVSLPIEEVFATP